MIDNIPPSPEYMLTEQLIAYLGSDSFLQPHVMADVYDSASQTSKISASTGQYGGCIAISPQEIAPAYPDQAKSLLRIRIGILIFCSSLAAGGSPQRLISGLTTRTLQLLGKWYPEGDRGIPYEQITIEQTMPLDLTQLEGISDLVGRGILISHRIYPISPANP